MQDDAGELNEFLVRFWDSVRELSDSHAIAETACRLVVEKLRVERAYWAELDWASRHYVIGASFHVPDVSVIHGRFSLDAWEPLTSFHLAGTPVVVNDTQTDHRIPFGVKQGYAKIEVGADLAAPVISGGRLRCALAINQRLPRVWKAKEVALVQGIRRWCWAEVERARSETVLRESEKRHAFLLTLSDALRPVEDAAEIGTLACHLLVEQFAASRAHYVVIEGGPGEEVAEVGGEFVVRGPLLVRRFPLAELGESVVSVLRGGTTLVLHDSDHDQRITPAESATFRSAESWSSVAVSLMEKERLVATLTVHDHVPRVWTPAEILIVEETAERIWAAVARARAEAALRDSEQNLHGVANIVPDLLWYSEPDGTTSWYNNRWLEYTGQTFEQAIGWGWVDAIHPEDREGLKQGYSQAVAQQRLLQQEHRIRRHTGEYRWFLVRAEPVCDAQGRVIRMYGAASDIDDLKRSEADQGLLVDISEDLARLSDENEIIQTVGTKLAAHLNLTCYHYVKIDESRLEATIRHFWHALEVPNVLGTYPVRDFIVPERLPKMRAGESTVVNDVAAELGEETEAEAALKAGAKQQKIAAYISVPCSQDGRWVSYFAVADSCPRWWSRSEIELIQEVSNRLLPRLERARSDRALHESEERFRLFVDNVREYALVQTDLEGVIQSWNPGAERLFRYTAEEVLRKPFAMLLPDEDRDKGLIAREMAKLARGEKVVDSHAVQRKDGSRFWAEWITEPVLDETGLRATAKIIRDDSERRDADNAIRGSLAEKEELLKEVHHRVKNNLQVITSLLNLQSANVDDERTLALLEETRNRVQSISIIHELLYRSESFASINLKRYAEQLLPSLVRFYGMQARVSTEILGDDSVLELERAVPFGLLLNEIVSNALKHAFPENASGSVKVEIFQRESGFTLRVSDTGPGLPAGFDVESSPTLGLKLVRILVRQLRGEFTVRRETETLFEVHISTQQ